MYQIAIHRPARPTESRTVENDAAVRDALLDLLTTTGYAIRDEDHTELMRLAAQLRDRVLWDGFGALLIEGHGALTVHDLDPVTA